MPTNEHTLVQEAKRLEKLQARRRKVRRELRELDASIKLSQKFIRGLTKGGPNANDPDDQLPPGWEGRVK